MITHRHKTKFAFSLAEALISLLIVALISLASVPVITKKKRDINSVPHGEWTCEINENGQHASWSQDSPTPVVHNEYCEFMPPNKAGNFVIKAVGGGGGGGAGFSELKLDALYPGDNRTIDFVANNSYDVVLIGGGGGGGGGNDERGGTRAYGGGSGAAVSFTYKPTYNISYSISAGRGGSGGHGDDGKHSGGDGENGGDTSFGGMVFAGGGTGGQAIQYDGAGRACTWKNLLNKKEIRTGRGCAGEYSMSDPSGSFKMTNVKSINGKNSTRNTSGATTSYYSSYVGEKMLQPTYSFPWPSRGINGNLASMKAGSIGMGGYGGQGKNSGGTTGMGGYAAVKSDVLTGGSAGQASQLMMFPAATLNKKIQVRLGRGGAGGRNVFTSSSHTLTEPTDGLITIVGDLFTAPGGKAGKNREIKPATSGSDFAEGEDGAVSGIAGDEKPSYGGRSIDGSSASTSNANIVTSYGGGGGGGGAKRTSGYGTESYTTYYSGNGSNGGNGKVVIKW